MIYGIGVFLNFTCSPVIHIFYITVCCSTSLIGLSIQSDPIFIGISRRELNVRPTAFFFLKCSLESKEVQQLYSKAQDGYESVQIYTVSRVSEC